MSRMHRIPDRVLFVCALVVPALLLPLVAVAGTPALFTDAQVSAGEKVYAARCIACHGSALEGTAAPALTGKDFAYSWGPDGIFAKSMGRAFTVEELAYVASTGMPPGEAKTLSAQEHAAVLAFVLSRNGYPSGDTPLKLDDPVLARTTLVLNADGIYESAPPELIAGDPASAPEGGGPTHDELVNAGPATTDWLMHNHDYAGTRFVDLDQITADNVNRLQVRCIVQLGEQTTSQTGPLVYKGTMYVTTTRRTLALDASTCQVLWTHEWTLRGAEGWVNNRGVAIKDGWLVRGTTDGYLLALNATTGKLVWARRVADSALGETITMAPSIYRDLVLIGPAGSENAVSGWVGAFRLQTGEPVWRFKTVPGADEPGGHTWNHAADIKVGGGAVWTPLSIDPATDDVHIAVTNPAPDLPAELRPGENLYTNSIVALDARTGTLRWYKQTVPNDDHDWDLTQVSPLVTTELNGKSRRLVVTVGKDGILRTLDRDSHEALYETPVTTIDNVDAEITTEGTRACPGINGGVLWNGPAWNPGTGLVYVGAVDWCTTFWEVEPVRYIPGRVHLGGVFQRDAVGAGWITAVDLRSGQTKWRYRSAAPMLAALTTTSGNLVFTGENPGEFMAMDARSGDVKYRFNTGGGMGGGVITYAVEGKQYVAAVSGPPGTNFTTGHLGSPTLLVFALPD